MLTISTVILNVVKNLDEILRFFQDDRRGLFSWVVGLALPLGICFANPAGELVLLRKAKSYLPGVSFALISILIRKTEIQVKPKLVHLFSYCVGLSPWLVACLPFSETFQLVQFQTDLLRSV